ncbi:MAG: LysR substrate-binding domain-containing protein [Lautropia sp.]
MPLRPFGVDFQHLLVFLAVYEARNVSSAAARVGRNQSTLSHSLARLRAELEDDLFVHRGREMVPTPLAHSIVAPVRQLLNQADEILRQRRPFSPARDSRDFVIGMTDYEETVFAPRLWFTIEQQAPGVRLIVRSTNRHEAARLVLEGGLDLAMVGNPVRRSIDLEYETLLRDPYAVAFATRMHPQRLTLKRYAKARHLSVEVGGERFGTVEDALRIHGIHRNVQCVVPNYARVPLILAGSRLMATLATGVFRRSPHRRSLTLVPPPFRIPPVEIEMVYARRQAADSAHRWVRELLRSLSESLASR